MSENLMQKLVSLAKQRGFIFPSSEIYGGFRSVYDYGPLGVEMKQNIRRLWWQAMVRAHDNIVGLDAAIFMNPKVWDASGHTGAGFSDPLVECKKCHKRFRKDKLKDAHTCPDCGAKKSFTDEKNFNLMVKTHLGVVEDDSTLVYLRGETAQGIYVNYENVRESMRLKLPFGVAQVGKAFRNEITPGNFIFRMREFEQMEMQYFVKPKEAEAQFNYWRDERRKWHESLGLKTAQLDFEVHAKDDLAHYAKAATDITYNFPFGVSELEGIHNRGDWDLSNHSKHSGQKLDYFDDANKERFTPHIVETSVGLDRLMLAHLVNAYTEEEVKSESRVVLKLHPQVAPIKAAVLPLSRKGSLIDLAHLVHNSLKNDQVTIYDETGSIGKRYRRQDEIGTPFCVTIDFDTLTDKAVTVRERDTMKQERIPIEKISGYVADQLEK